MMIRKRPPIPQEIDAEPRTDGDRALHAAFRKKFEEALAGEGVLTPRALVEIGELARLAHEAITIGRMPNLRRRGFGYGNEYEITGAMEATDSMSIGAIGALAPAPPVENFGVAAVRELVEAARKMSEKKDVPTAAELVQAIATAKREGEADLEAVLRLKLGELLGSGSTPLSEAEAASVSPPS